MFRVTPAELRAALKLPNRRGGGRRADRTVKTIMSSVTIHNRRVNGAQGDFGDLTWITVDSLKLTSQDPAVRPVVDGAAHPSASGAAAVPLALSTKKRLIEDLRQALVAGRQLVISSGMPDAQQKQLLSQYEQQFQDLGTEADDISRDLFRQRLTRQLSARQQNDWISWDAVLRAVDTLIGEFQVKISQPDIARRPMQWKRIQNILLLAMHVLIPPLRNDFERVRVILGEPDEEDLRENRSPNYLQLTQDGRMLLVLNAYKTDKRALSAGYDGAQGDFLLNHARTVVRELTPDPVLNKYGFRPNLLRDMIVRYQLASAAVFGTRNPKAYLFYDFDSDGVVTPVGRDALSKRLGRVLKKETGKAPRAQLLRPIFLSWFSQQGPSMAERDEIAEWMLHTTETALDTYTKDANYIGQKRPRTMEPEETGEL